MIRLLSLSSRAEMPFHGDEWDYLKGPVFPVTENRHPDLMKSGHLYSPPWLAASSAPIPDARRHESADSDRTRRAGALDQSSTYWRSHGGVAAVPLRVTREPIGPIVCYSEANYNSG